MSNALNEIRAQLKHLTPLAREQVDFVGSDVNESILASTEYGISDNANKDFRVITSLLQAYSHHGRSAFWLTHKLTKQNSDELNGLTKDEKDLLRHLLHYHICDSVMLLRSLSLLEESSVLGKPIRSLDLDEHTSGMFPAPSEIGFMLARTGLREYDVEYIENALQLATQMPPEEKKALERAIQISNKWKTKQAKGDLFGDENNIAKLLAELIRSDNYVGFEGLRPRFISYRNSVLTKLVNYASKVEI